MDVADIKDKRSLEAWLNSWPRRTEVEKEQAHNVAVQIAHRAAMRVLPLYWEWSWKSNDYDFTDILTVLRLNLFVGVTCFRPSAIFGSAAVSVKRIADGYSNYRPRSGLALQAVVLHAGAKRAAYAVHVAITSLQNYGYAATIAASHHKVGGIAIRYDWWFHIRADASALHDGRDAMTLPLWHDTEPPFERDFQDVKGYYGNDPQWKFWIEWYESALHGRPQNWDMLTEIALIKPETWDQGPDTVNPVIEKIRLKYAIAATANAEVMSVNRETGKLRVDPLSDMPPDHLVDAIDRLRNVITLFDFEGAQGNQFSPIRTEVDILSKACDDYRERPRMLHSSCSRVVRRLETKFETGVCPEPDKDADIGDLYQVVSRVCADLFERDPYVREAVELHLSSRLSVVDAEQAGVIIHAAEEVSDRSEGVLQEETLTLANEAINPDLPEARRKEAFYVVASRLIRARAILAYRTSKAVLAEIESVTKTIAGISKNTGVIATAIAGLTSPVWLGKAVAYIMTLIGL